MSYLDEIKARYDIKDYVEPTVNIPELPTEGIVLIVGTSGSGKTTILKTVDDPKPLVIDNEKSVIDAVLKAAGYTYGPLLGLFTFGLFTKRHIRGISVLLVCILAPCIAFLLSTKAPEWFNGYQIDIEIVIINGLITFFGLCLVSKSDK